VDSETRSAILSVGILLCVGFAALTIYVASTAPRFNLGTIILTVVSLGVDLMILLGLIGALRNPPR
jgi:hypothetical protein